MAPQRQEHQATTKAQTTAAALTPFLRVPETTQAFGMVKTPRVTLQSFGISMSVIQLERGASPYTTLTVNQEC